MFKSHVGADRMFSDECKKSFLMFEFATDLGERIDMVCELTWHPAN